MDLLDIDVNKRPGAIQIGVQGENEAEGVAFDVTPWVTDYGLGTAYIYNQRNGDAAPYFKELPITSSDGVYTATWIYDDADTAVAGEGTVRVPDADGRGRRGIGISDPEPVRVGAADQEIHVVGPSLLADDVALHPGRAGHDDRRAHVHVHAAAVVILREAA